MNDIDKTLDFRWADGTIMMWSRWGNGEPNHHRGYEPYGAVGTHYIDLAARYSQSGLCEKTGKYFI